MELTRSPTPTGDDEGPKGRELRLRLVDPHLHLPGPGGRERGEAGPSAPGQPVGLGHMRAENEEVVLNERKALRCPLAREPGERASDRGVELIDRPERLDTPVRLPDAPAAQSPVSPASPVRV